MTFPDLVRRYQSYDPVTRSFTARRTNEQFAAALGVHGTLLGRLYSGQTVDSVAVARGLVRLFPEALAEVSRVFLVEAATSGAMPAEVA